MRAARICEFKDNLANRTGFHSEYKKSEHAAISRIDRAIAWHEVH